eukprot:3389159-Amphidinium_carterae.1
MKTAGSEHRVLRSYVKSLVKGLGLSHRKNMKRGEVEIEQGGVGHVRELGSQGCLYHVPSWRQQGHGVQP